MFTFIKFAFAIALVSFIWNGVDAFFAKGSGKQEPFYSSSSKTKFSDVIDRFKNNPLGISPKEATAGVERVNDKIYSTRETVKKTSERVAKTVSNSSKSKKGSNTLINFEDKGIDDGHTGDPTCDYYPASCTK